MRVNLAFVPPGGGETDYSLSIELPEMPHAGDYVSVFRQGSTGTEDFIVKRTWWGVSSEDGDAEPISKLKEVWIECEFALGHTPSESHKSVCKDYEAKTGKLLQFDSSVY